MLDRSCYPKSMNKKSIKQSSDINIIASRIVAKVTGEPPEDKPIKEKNPAAVALGRMGGLKGGKARAEKLSAKKRKEIAKKAAKVRWSK
jgi:hypothetical protein